MTSAPGAVRKCTRILEPGKASEKTPRALIPPVSVKYRRTFRKKKCGRNTVYLENQSHNLPGHPFFWLDVLSFHWRSAWLTQSYSPCPMSTRDREREREKKKREREKTPPKRPLPLTNAAFLPRRQMWCQRPVTQRGRKKKERKKERVGFAAKGQSDKLFFLRRVRSVSVNTYADSLTISQTPSQAPRCGNTGAWQRLRDTFLH
jgi:hypothetical protein